MIIRCWICLILTWCIFVKCNDDRNYAIKVANCRRLCFVKVNESTTIMYHIMTCFVKVNDLHYDVYHDVITYLSL